MKRCSDIFPRTLSVPKSEQFNESGSSSKIVSFEEQITSKADTNMLVDVISVLTVFFYVEKKLL